MADSKSFFEKLTGSVKIDDESAEVNKGGGAEEISSDVDDAEVITAASSTFPRAKKEEKQENYYYKELNWGTFSRSVVLPGEVDIEKAEATLKNGILTVRLPKKDKIRQQKIKVKVG